MKMSAISRLICLPRVQILAPAPYLMFSRVKRTGYIFARSRSRPARLTGANELLALSKIRNVRA